MIALIIRTDQPDRVEEALRCALGLGLRGEEVHVVAKELPSTAGILRALKTLEAVGQSVQERKAEVLSDLIRRARAVEVWT